MKRLLFTIIFCVLGIYLFSQQVVTENFKVKVGFHCPNGKKLLETKLAEVPGIINFKVDLETKVIDFDFDPAQISKEQIIVKIEEIGYYTEFSDKNKPIKKACSHDHDDDDDDHVHDHGN
jgi:copper chaperone CopZ